MTEPELPVYGLADLRTVLRREDMLQAVREAFIRHSHDEVVSPAPGQLLFEHPPGDCHIKYGYFKGGPVFAIKIAMGFYDNPLRGLSTNNGLVLVFDAKTGKTKAILNDQGWLTSWRTAAAGALAAKAGAPSQVTALGIVGTGHQAEHQARWAAAELGIEQVFIWGRDPDKAARLARQLGDFGLKANAAPTVEELLARCNVVITCTPSTAPIIPAAAVKPGTHIVALGADSPGKQELDPAIFTLTRVVMTDDHRQCVHHGEFGHGVRAGLVDENADVSLGQVLAGKARGRTSDTDITLADLTGIAAQDIALATLAIERIQPQSQGDGEYFGASHR